jgi:hypothetical protein
LCDRDGPYWVIAMRRFVRSRWAGACIITEPEAIGKVLAALRRPRAPPTPTAA